MIEHLQVKLVLCLPMFSWLHQLELEFCFWILEIKFKLMIRYKIMDHILRFHLTDNSACHHYECWCQGKRLEIFIFWFLITFFLPFYHNMTIMFLFAECFTSLYCGINRHCGIVYSQLFHINGFLWIQLLYSIRIYITWSFSSSYFWRVSLEFLPLSAEWWNTSIVPNCSKGG